MGDRIGCELLRFLGTYRWCLHDAVHPCTQPIERLTKPILDSMGDQLHPGYLSLFREPKPPP